MTDKNTKQINTDASNAVRLISDAAAKATTTIADAALAATKLLAVQTAEATKITSIKGADDHDFLLSFSSEVKVKLDTIRDDIKDLSDGTAARITTLENEKLNIRDSYTAIYKTGVEKSLTDHEERIRINTDKITQIRTFGTAAVIALGILEFILSKVIK